MTLDNEGASVAPPRELPKPLKRGPLEGCLRISILFGGIGDFVFILRVQNSPLACDCMW